MGGCRGIVVMSSWLIVCDIIVIVKSIIVNLPHGKLCISPSQLFVLTVSSFGEKGEDSLSLQITGAAWLQTDWMVSGKIGQGFRHQLPHHTLPGLHTVRGHLIVFCVNVLKCTLSFQFVNHSVQYTVYMASVCQDIYRKLYNFQYQQCFSTLGCDCNHNCKIVLQYLDVISLFF